jgi:hypothetical protein
VPASPHLPAHLTLKVAATLPFHVLCSLGYCLVVLDLAGLLAVSEHHGLTLVASAVAITCMLSLIAVQVREDDGAVSPLAGEINGPSCAIASILARGGSVSHVRCTTKYVHRIP